MATITFDATANRIKIITDSGEEILIAPQQIRDLLPTLNEEEKIKDLEMILHDIDREALTKMEAYIAVVKKIEEDIVDARASLEKCSDMICIRKWQAMIQSFVDQKSILAEIRRAVALLEKDRRTIRIRLAHLETEG